MSCLFDKDISEMNFKELREAVQLLYDRVVKTERKYNDALQNIDVDNLGRGYTVEQNNMKAQLKITVGVIKTLVSETDLANKLEAYSTIEQTARFLKTIVSKSLDLSEAVEVSSEKYMTDESKVYVIRDADKDGNVLSEVYYYYNGITEEWHVLSGDNIYTVFEQTANGFALRGNVLIDGNTVITKNLKLKGNYWTLKMSNDELVFCDDNDNEKLKLGAHTVGDEYYYPYIFVGAGSESTKRGCIEKMRNGLWIGDASVFGYENLYPGTNTPPSHGASTSLGTGIFLDFENGKIFTYQGGKIREIGTAVFG